MLNGSESNSKVFWKLPSKVDRSLSLFVLRICKWDPLRFKSNSLLLWSTHFLSSDTCTLKGAEVRRGMAVAHGGSLGSEDCQLIVGSFPYTSCRKKKCSVVSDCARASVRLCVCFLSCRVLIIFFLGGGRRRATFLSVFRLQYTQYHSS